MMKKIINKIKRFLIYFFYNYNDRKKIMPLFYSDDELITEINKGKSLARFGDGEFKLIFGENIGFQNYELELKKDLINCLLNNNNNLIICLPKSFYILDNLTKDAKKFNKLFLYKYGSTIDKIINKEIKYGNTQITRFYMDYIDKSVAQLKVLNLKKIWNNKEILIVEGKNTMLGVGNDLFENSKNIRRIIIPNKNSYKNKEKIINAVKENVNEDEIVLIAAGPTATVLAYEMSKIGIQSIDIGHIDIEYEWFLSKTSKKIPIANKNVNEVNDNKDDNSSIDDDEKYKKQILLNIL